MVKSGTGAWQTPLAKALWLEAHVVITGGMLSVTVNVAVQVDSLFAASITCKVTVVTPRPTSVPAAGVWVICSGADPLQSVATRPLVVKSGTGAWQTPLAKALWLEAHVVITGGILFVTVNVAVQVDSLFAASITCKVTVVTPRPTSVPAAGVWVICSGADPLQSVATRPLVVKSGTGAWQTPLAKALWLEAHVVITGGMLSVTVNVAVQVDSLFAASITCKVTVVTPRPTSVPAAGVWVICSGADPLQSVATRPLVVKSGTGAWQTPLAKALWLEAHVVITGGMLSVTVNVAVQVDSLFAASVTCKVTVVTPRPTSVPGAGVRVICSGADPLQSLATRPLVVKSGTGAWQTPSAKALWLEAHVVITGGVLSVTVKVAVQV